MTTATITRETTIGALAEGDVVLAIEGKPRPFPYVVAQVVNHRAHGVTFVRFAHGGLAPPCDSDTAATVAA